jgi:hypothetical protein
MRGVGKGIGKGLGKIRGEGKAEDVEESGGALKRIGGALTRKKAREAQRERDLEDYGIYKRGLEKWGEALPTWRITYQKILLDEEWEEKEPEKLKTFEIQMAKQIQNQVEGISLEAARRSLVEWSRAAGMRKKEVEE